MKASARSAVAVLQQQADTDKTWQPENTRDSWNRVWTFLDWHLDPFHTIAPQSTK